MFINIFTALILIKNYTKFSGWQDKNFCRVVSYNETKHISITQNEYILHDFSFYQ